jgi:hypothetical protein
MEEYIRRGWPPRVAAIYSGVVPYNKKYEFNMYISIETRFEAGKVTEVDHRKQVETTLGIKTRDP